MRGAQGRIVDDVAVGTDQAPADVGARAQAVEQHAGGRGETEVVFLALANGSDVAAGRGAQRQRLRDGDDMA